MELGKERPRDICRACRLLRMSRSSLFYKSVKDDSKIVDTLRSYASKHPDEGFWKYFYRLRNQNESVNHKRVYRIYKTLGLSLRRKVKKRLPARVKEPLVVPAHFTHTWSIDFMSDALIGSRKFRSFHVIDDYNREVLFVEQDYSIKSSRVIWVLRHLINRYGKPKKIRMDNGPEFIADLAKRWSNDHGIEFKYIEPGKPTQNAYIERFNKSFRVGVLDAYLFEDLDQVRAVTAEWVTDYNDYRPHEALGNISPVKYREMNTIKDKPPVPRYASASPLLHSAQEKHILNEK